MRAALALVLALLAGAAPGAAEARNGGAPDRFADRIAIENTLQAYVRALDGSDLDAYLATLTADAKFLSKEGNYLGRAAIADYVRPVMEARRKRLAAGDKSTKATHHVITNEAWTFVDRDHVVIRSYWMFVVAHATGGNTIDAMGNAEDHFVRQNGQWLINERHIETF